MTTFPVMPSGAEHVLVASPSTVVRQRVLESLLPKARRVEQASGGAEALVHLEKGSWQVLLLDRHLPDLDAEELSQTVRQRYPAVEVVLLDAHHEMQDEIVEIEPPVTFGRPSAGGLDEAVGAAHPVHSGNFDPDGETGGMAVRQRSERDLVRSHSLPGMVGSSAAMQSVYHMVRRLAPRDTTVLITGPTGSGKELIARALHELSPRSARSFAVVNCAAIPETLLEAELFGYSRGAFTGAWQSYAGRIQTAHLGTLFLDEIGDMPLSLQPKLLRFLEQKEIQRLGSSQLARVDVRVVAATNVDLQMRVEEAKFREDLYYRLCAFPLAVPPLAERPGDVVQLADYFLEKFSPLPPPPVLSEEASALLRAQRWPGNVRELQNVIERALILADGEGLIRPSHLMRPEMGLRRPGTIGHPQPARP
jgi:DNA-binding NtrC family response regulator